MRVFFLSEQPCALSVGGAYLGIVDGFERSVELDPADRLFCELVPAENFLPVRFWLDENFLISPPPRIELYYTETAVCIRAVDFLRADQTLRVLWQKRFKNALLTLTMQGKLQLFFGGTVSRLLDLPDCLSDCDAEETALGYLLRGKSAFCLVSFDGELEVVSEGNVLACEKTLKAEIPFHDSLLHTAVCEWERGKLVSCLVRTPNPLAPASYALALFESALIGADCAPFLCPALEEKASSLKEYLGNFCSVVLCDKPDKIGLVYKRSERVYEVRYFCVETEKEKISNIRPL